MKYFILCIALFCGLTKVYAQDSLVIVDGISAKLPQGWSGFEKDDKVFFMSSQENEQDLFNENININKRQTSKNYTTADFKQLAGILQEQLKPNFKALKNYKAVVGKNMLTISYNANVGEIDGDLYFKQRFITKNKIQYTITLTANAADVKSIAIADKVMESIIIK